ncbi:SGNH/GDSL hydrolase family protein [Acetobacter sp.]|uniref:SGNH/GDSL hydrolase family protein n=1 Tax=Acetobacter sp. TaxID=440 RepID=UPI0039EB5ACA
MLAPAFGAIETTPPTPPTATHLYVFGDSYSDSGALLTLTTEAVRAHVPGAVILPAPEGSRTYWEGRWSNGPTAVEVLAHQMGVGIDNYAVGGARSGSGNYDSWLDSWADTGLRSQVMSYLSGRRQVDPGALYILGASANDFFQKMAFSKPVLERDVAFDSAQDVQNAVEMLARRGARRFLILLSYPLAQVPALAGHPEEVALAEQFEQDFDRDVRDDLAVLEKTDGITIKWFSVKEAMEEVVSNAAAYHLTNLTQPCQPTLPRVGVACRNPSSYLWWDEFHPTHKVHGIMAGKMAEALSRH